MKTFLCCLVLCGANLAVDLRAQSQVVPAAAVSARDGFTRSSSTGVLFTQNNVTVKLERPMVLTNGLRVQPDGAVLLPNGEKAELHNNQLLTLEGKFEDVALTPQGVAPVTSVVPPEKK